MSGVNKCGNQSVLWGKFHIYLVIYVLACSTKPKILVRNNGHHNDGLLSQAWKATFGVSCDSSSEQSVIYSYQSDYHRDRW